MSIGLAALISGCANQEIRGIATFAGWNVDASAVKPGMPQEEARAKLGEPRHESSRRNYERTWDYGGLTVVNRNGFVSFVGRLEESDAFEIRVKSIHDDKHQTKGKVVVLPSVAGVSSGDLFFKKYLASYVGRVLSGLGYEVVNEDENPTIAVFVYWDIIDTSKTFNRTYPVYGVTSFGSQSNFVASTSDPFGLSITRGQISQGPQFGAVGTATSQYTVNSYLRRLAMEAVDFHELKEKHRADYFWQLSMISEGRMSDLDAVLPVLVAASVDYIDSDSVGLETFRIYKQDPTIEFVKGAFVSPLALSHRLAMAP